MTTYYSIDNDKIKINSNSTGTTSGITYDLFSKTTIDIIDTDYSIYIVELETECKIEEICKRVYNNYKYCEELLAYNDIVDPFNISIGDEIRYLNNPDGYSKMYKKDVDYNKDILDRLIKNNNKKSTIKSTIPTIKPENLKQINIDYNNKEITINNKYQ